MTWVEEAEIAWPVDALTFIGFTEAEAVRLQVALPPIEAGVLASVALGLSLRDQDGCPNPTATVLHATYDFGAQVALRLAYSGRDVLDLVVILDAVQALEPRHVWPPAKTALADEWANAERVPADRVARYISAGVTPAEATTYEATTATRPSDGQLVLLAALRQGGASNRMRSCRAGNSSPTPS